MGIKKKKPKRTAWLIVSLVLNHSDYFKTPVYPLRFALSGGSIRFSFAGPWQGLLFRTRAKTHGLASQNGLLHDDLKSGQYQPTFCKQDTVGGHQP